MIESKSSRPFLLTNLLHTSGVEKFNVDIKLICSPGLLLMILKQVLEQAAFLFTAIVDYHHLIFIFVLNKYLFNPKDLLCLALLHTVDLAKLTNLAKRVNTSAGYCT